MIFKSCICVICVLVLVKEWEIDDKGDGWSQRPVKAHLSLVDFSKGR